MEWINEIFCNKQLSVRTLWMAPAYKKSVRLYKRNKQISIVTIGICMSHLWIKKIFTNKLFIYSFIYLFIAQVTFIINWKIFLLCC